MLIFPDGAGIAAICISFLSLIMTFIFKKRGNKTAKKTFLFILGISSIYLIAGLCLFFRPSFYTHGYVYFSSGIKEKHMVSYIDANESVHGLVKDLFPDAKIIRNNKVERKDGVTIDIEKLDGGINNTRATIRIYTYDSREEAKSEYDMEIASTKNSFPEKFLKSSHGYYSAANHEDWSFCVFPVKFDGTKFLLPYVDQGGAYFEIHIYYENSYAIISERAEKVFKLLLPDNFRHR